MSTTEWINSSVCVYNEIIIIVFHKMNTIQLHKHSAEWTKVHHKSLFTYSSKTEETKEKKATTKWWLPRGSREIGSDVQSLEGSGLK